MGKNFTRASDHKISLGSSPLSAYPCTMAAWGRTSNATFYQTLVVIEDSTDSHYAYLVFRNSAGAQTAVLDFQAGGANRRSETTTTYSADTWHHLCAVMASATDRRVYLDAGGVGSNVTSTVFPTVDRGHMGSDETSAGGAALQGDLGDVAMWNVELTTSEIAALAKGMDPRLIRPSALVFYFRGWDNEPYIDRSKSNVALTNSGSVAAGAHPRMFYKKRRHIRRFTTAAAAGIVGPLFGGRHLSGGGILAGRLAG